MKGITLHGLMFTGTVKFLLQPKKIPKRVSFIMQQAQSGDQVKVHYHGRLTTGETFDSSAGREPLEFTVGSGMVIKGFDEGVTGMGIGEKKTITIPVNEAYGPVNPQMVFNVPKSNLPAEITPEPGMQLMMHAGGGQQLPVVITEVLEDHVVIDGNHPLAGQDLVFDLELVEIGGRKSSIILEP